jgi:hypothetical protein
MLRKAIFVLIIIVLTLNFAFNIFDIADQKWFEIGCASSDNLVIMKIIRLAQNPFDLESTFMAFIGHEYSPDLYVAYMDGTRSLGELSENNYFSSLGFQGLFYGLIACLFFWTDIVTVSIILSVISSLLLATVLTLLIFWISREFGKLTAVVVFITLIISQLHIPLHLNTVTGNT